MELVLRPAAGSRAHAPPIKPTAAKPGPESWTSGLCYPAQSPLGAWDGCWPQGLDTTAWSCMGLDHCCPLNDAAIVGSDARSCCWGAMEELSTTATAGVSPAAACTCWSRALGVWPPQGLAFELSGIFFLNIFRLWFVESVDIESRYVEAGICLNSSKNLLWCH